MALALLSLFFTERAKIDVMEIDAVLRETHTATATVSDNPIEDGGVVSDHVIQNPLELTMDCVISRSPLGFSALAGSAATAKAGQVTEKEPTSLVGNVATTALASLGGLVAGALSGIGATRDPGDVYNFLLGLQVSAKRLEIVTGLRNYENMILNNISVPRASTDGNTIRFTVGLRQVQIVSSQVTFLSAATGSINDQAQPTNKLGKQASSSPSAKTESNGSILYEAFN